MLIEKKLKENDIIAMKLISGDEIVAKLKLNSEYVVEVSKPIAIGISPQGAVFAPFMITSSEDVEMTFDKKHILSMIKVRKEVEDAYIQQTSSITRATGLPADLSAGNQ